MKFHETYHSIRTWNLLFHHANDPDETSSEDLAGGTKVELCVAQSHMSRGARNLTGGISAGNVLTDSPNSSAHCSSK